MNINWYPGHMKKTKELIKEQLKLVDIVWELVDARVPISSKNPDIDDLIKSKPKLIILNKKDLAEDRVTNEWIEYYKTKNYIMANNSLSPRQNDELMKKTKEILKEKIDRLKEKGVNKKVIRIMIVGIPNVGKSSIINSFLKKKSAKTGNRPGVTKGKQWIRLREDVELLDTPGVLWPKLENQETGINLALFGTIKDEIMDREELGYKLLEVLWPKYKSRFIDRYKIDEEFESTLEIMDKIGEKRGCILKRGEIDYLRVSNLLLDDLRSGRLGKITLERPK